MDGVVVHFGGLGRRQSDMKSHFCWEKLCEAVNMRFGEVLRSGIAGATEGPFYPI